MGRPHSSSTKPGHRAKTTEIERDRGERERRERERREGVANI